MRCRRCLRGASCINGSTVHSDINSPNHRSRPLNHRPICKSLSSSCAHTIHQTTWLSLDFSYIMLPIKTSLPMGLVVICVLQTATMTACYQIKPASNGSYGSYYNTLFVFPPTTLCTTNSTIVPQPITPRTVIVLISTSPSLLTTKLPSSLETNGRTLTSFKTPLAA